MAYIVVQVHKNGRMVQIFAGDVKAMQRLRGVLAKVGLVKIVTSSIKPKQIASKKKSRKAMFRRVHSLAKPVTEREFAALVAVYRDQRFNKSTQTRDILACAKRVGRPFGNASMSLVMATKNGDTVLDREEIPKSYRPTQQATIAWSKFVKEVQDAQN